MDRVWDNGGKYGKYVLRFQKSKKTLCTLYIRDNQLGVWITNGSVEFSEMLLNGISPLRALKAATSTAAEMLNLNVGSIIEGKYADIIAMPKNPFEDISVTEKVNFVMKGGKVYRNDNN